MGFLEIWNNIGGVGCNDLNHIEPAGKEQINVKMSYINPNLRTKNTSPEKFTYRIRAWKIISSHHLQKNSRQNTRNYYIMIFHFLAFLR